MTYDESFAAITNALTGRMVDHVERKGKELIICTTCGHEVVLKADVNHDIQFGGCGVRFVLPGIPVFGEKGAL